MKTLQSSQSIIRPNNIYKGYLTAPSHSIVPIKLSLCVPLLEFEGTETFIAKLQEFVETAKGRNIKSEWTNYYLRERNTRKSSFCSELIARAYQYAGFLSEAFLHGNTSLSTSQRKKSFSLTRQTVIDQLRFKLLIYILLLLCFARQRASVNLLESNSSL